MFLEYFGLREQPFGVTPDPRYLFPSPGHREALASLIYGIESNLGFSSLIAKPGMGKTTLLFHILEQYRQSARTAFIFNTQCNSYDLLRSLLNELDDQAVSGETFQLHERFKQILAGEAQAQRRVIVVIDEAQNLGDMVMETIRLLSNFESINFKLLHIVLAGQPELAARLTRPELSQLQQRIPILTSLQQLSRQEIALYIDHRLHVAGYRGRPLFTQQAMAQIARLSGGVPREINRLCFNCLSLACATAKPVVDLPVLEEVTADLDLNHQLGRKEDASARQAPMSSSPPTILRAAATSSQVQRLPSQAEQPARKVSKPTTIPTPPAVAASPFSSQRTGAYEQRKSLGAQKPKRRSRASFSLSGGWTSYRRPIGFALFYLSLVAAGWTAITRWAYPNLTAAVAPASPQDTSGSAPVPELLPKSDPKPNRASAALFRNGSNRKPAIAAREKRPGSAAGWPPPAARPQPDAEGPRRFQASFDLPLTDASGSTGAPPELVKYVRPLYPKTARDRHIEGTVVLSAVVTRDGRVRDVKPVRGDPTLLKAAESAMQDWVYRPYRINGKPVDVDTEVVISFSLPKEP